MYKHILVPTDGSPQSKKADRRRRRTCQGDRRQGDRACSPRRRRRPIVYRNNLPVGFTTPADHKKIIEQTARAHTSTSSQQAAKKAGVPCEVMTVTSDYPADTILETAKKKKCDLIVMATHGRRGISGVLLGSETQRVVTHAEIPVLVYP